MLNNSLTEIYYHIRPFIPRKLQLFMRRILILRNVEAHADVWPIDPDAAPSPDKWTGWPDGKKFALLITHDVETSRGHDKCWELMNVDQKMGFCSSFNFVPERYDVSPRLRNLLTDNGFEVGVHDLKHDGKLYKSEKIFKERAKRINSYLKEWNCVGFRSGSMHCNLDWIHNLKIKYDSSTFDTDPFEPLPSGVRTIYPFWVAHRSNGKGYVEIPYTLPQDFTLFVLMQEKNIDIWKRKLDWIVENGGMAVLPVHPDYINFHGETTGLEEYPVQYYESFLRYIKESYEGQYWNVLPKDVASFCSEWKHNILDSREITNAQ